MKIDVSKIPGYAEMTPDDKLKALESFEYDDGADVIAKLKESVSKANSQAAEWKNKHNALLTEEEKAKIKRDEEFEQMKVELEEVKKEKAVSDYTAKYVSLGYSSELAQSTAKALVSGDVVTILANQATFNKELQSKIEADLMKKTPRPKTGTDADVTQEEFDKMSYADRAKLFAENKELYEKLNGGN